MIKADGLIIHCIWCGGHNLNLIEDELICSYTDTKFDRIIKCEFCDNYFSQEFVADNLESFTSEESLAKIIKKKLERRQYYTRPVKTVIVEVEKPKKRRKRRKSKSVGIEQGTLLKKVTTDK